MMTLRDLRPGQTAEVTAVITEDDERLVRLAALGLTPGSSVRLQQRFPTYIVWVGETLLSMEQTVAADIWLRLPEDDLDRAR